MLVTADSCSRSPSLRCCCFARSSHHRPSTNTAGDSNPYVAVSTGSQTQNSWPVDSQPLGARRRSSETGAWQNREVGLGSGIEPHQTFSRMSPYSPNINQGLVHEASRSRPACRDQDHHVQEIMRAALAGELLLIKISMHYAIIC